MPFKSADGGRLNDEAFLRLLAYNSAPRELKGKKEQPGGVALADLPLVANDVVKVFVVTYVGSTFQQYSPATTYWHVFHHVKQ